MLGRGPELGGTIWLLWLKTWRIDLRFLLAIVIHLVAGADGGWVRGTRGVTKTRAVSR